MTLLINNEIAIEATQLVLYLAQEAEEHDANVLVLQGDTIRDVRKIKRLIDELNTRASR